MRFFKAAREKTAKICWNCRHSEEIGGEWDNGVCRRYPPAVFIGFGRDRNGKLAAQAEIYRSPGVFGNLSCGEFSPRGGPWWRFW